MQETFLKALESLHRFDGSCKLSTWLCQIARHLLYQHWEKTNRARLEELDDTLEAADNTQRQAMARIELADVWERLQLLPEEMKKTVELRVLGSLSFREIGAILGKSENWARVTFHRAKVRLLETETR